MGVALKSKKKAVPKGQPFLYSLWGLVLSGKKTLNISLEADNEVLVLTKTGTTWDTATADIGGICDYWCCRIYSL